MSILDKEFDLDIILVAIFSGIVMIGLIFMTGYWISFRNEYCTAIGLQLFNKPLNWFECLVV